MLIRIIKALPAPLMDGFVVRGFRVEGVYDVETRLARYLVVAQYAVALHGTSSEKSKSGKRR
jgi:hypothetical protein